MYLCQRADYLFSGMSSLKDNKASTPPADLLLLKVHSPDKKGSWSNVIASEKTYMLKVVNLYRYFGSTPAVTDVSFSVGTGNILALLGPNGAGKTTSLQMMCGLITPSSGDVLINGYSIIKQSKKAKMSLGFVPDIPFASDMLRGREYLSCVASLYGLSRKVAEERSEELLDRFRLSDAAHKVLAEYSLGMKKRLLICAAMLHRPEVVILDEPFSGLDPIATQLVKQSIVEQAGAGRTVVLSTHSLATAYELANYIAVLNHGSLVGGCLMENQIDVSVARIAELEELFRQMVEDRHSLEVSSPGSCSKSMTDSENMTAGLEGI